MRFILRLCLTILIIKSVTARKPEIKFGEYVSKDQRAENSLLLSKVVQILVDQKLRSNARRAINEASLAKAMKYFDSMKNKEKQDKHTLRGGPRDEQATLVESELKSALSHKKSSLYDRPYVAKQGKNDFLVMRPEVVDPFVTVVPNHIYYDAEKKCVNWLDDCSLQGIRAKLLRGAQSPYK